MNAVLDQQLVLDLFLVPLAALVSAILIILLRPMLRKRATAQPNARSSHAVPTPQGGGIGVVTTTIILSAAVCLGLHPASTDLLMLAPILVATALIAAVGWVDDVRTIEVAPRLVLQAVIIGAVIATLPAGVRVLPAIPLWPERALLLLGGIWFVNLVNFMDGIDWMTVAEAVPLTAGLSIVSFAGALPHDGFVIAIVLGGAMLGFAPFNRPVATLFLGDVGSLPVGLLLGWLLVLLAGQGHLAAAVLLPLYYLADSTLTLIRRARRGERVWRAHREHFYQRATANGLSVTAVVSRVFIVNVGLVALAVLTVWFPYRAVTLPALAVGVMIVGVLLASFVKGGRAA